MSTRRKCINFEIDNISRVKKYQLKFQKSFGKVLFYFSLIFLQMLMVPESTPKILFNFFEL